MAITKFIPQIWNARMLTDFSEQATAANVVNREYEGDARKGNTVKITFAQAVQVKDYKENNRTTSADPVSDRGLDLLIDQEKNFDFYVDDIDRAQAAGSMEAYTRSAAEGLVEDADKFILSLAAAGDASPTPGDVTTGDGVYDLLNDLRKRLNKALAPKSNRVVFINAELEAVLLQADSKLSSVDTSGTPQGLRDAIVGRLLGFTVISTENLPKTDSKMAVAMYAPSLAFVSQIQETEALRAQDKFADRLRGLHVYGGKVIRPEGIAVYDGSLTGA